MKRQLPHDRNAAKITLWNSCSPVIECVRSFYLTNGPVWDQMTSYFKQTSFCTCILMKPTLPAAPDNVCSSARDHKIVDWTRSINQIFTPWIRQRILVIPERIFSKLVHNWWQTKRRVDAVYLIFAVDVMSLRNRMWLFLRQLENCHRHYEA